ncbi:hypothetical protein [Sulfobacillus thermosulfidooxidans]|uniref:hypothetical protein n=1 Tax=Sulfobacillus thermosulfidooxidans TaxID=28034 RepID=UPI00096B8566|nr:hypothetical protein [Sulfobacillus thermosulfidooxidans]OLZ11197.1 hypothetical protein BFX05_07915 [Sulfobacillus thermosulfidooxidans]OLZ13464.1 hypothetical protein BFX06_09850 [Sulfobacillus thermosulfidooxidans]OLZ21711.1 hypothetical protein BFX07_12900 [Sulfobacillus thermosulfidooxidans]
MIVPKRYAQLRAASAAYIISEQEVLDALREEIHTLQNVKHWQILGQYVSADQDLSPNGVLMFE